HEKQVATFSVETLQEHERTVLDLQVRISDGMEQSLEELLYAMDAAHPRLYNACNELALSILQPEGTATDVSVQLARFIDIAAQCRDIQAQLHDSPSLQKLRDAGVAPDRQLAHFATLEAICRAMSRPVHSAIDALERAREFKTIAQSMVRRPRKRLGNERNKQPALDARDKDMGEFVDALRHWSLAQPVNVERQAAINFFVTAKEDLFQAYSKAEELASRLHCILPIDPLSDATAASNLGEASAAQTPSMLAADEAMVALQLQIANAAIDHRKHALKLPTDVPAGIRAKHEAAMLVLCHVELCSSTSAEIIDIYHRAFHELRAAAPASQRKIAERHAESLKKLIARIGKAVGQQISVAPQTEGDQKVVSDVTSELTQFKQLSETMRLGLEGVGRLFEARRKAQTIKHRLTADEPRESSLDLDDAEREINNVYQSAEDWLDKMERASSGTAEGGDAEINGLRYLVWRAAFDRQVALGMMLRDWFMARLATANSGALSDFELEDLVKRAIHITTTLTTGNNWTMRLFRSDPQQTRAFLKVTMVLLKEIQDLKSKFETKLQSASSAAPALKAIAPASLQVDASASKAPSDVQHRPGQGDAGTTSRGESSKKKGKSGRTRRR
ncbi:MAG: hypothetical protein JF606_24485, partial [Burkholderiales bacterium]|nr:hypothetical protein [Burkholderiales bacterium]